MVAYLPRRVCRTPSSSILESSEPMAADLWQCTCGRILESMNLWPYLWQRTCGSESVAVPVAVYLWQRTCGSEPVAVNLWH